MFLLACKPYNWRTLLAKVLHPWVFCFLMHSVLSLEYWAKNIFTLTGHLDMGSSYLSVMEAGLKFSQNSCLLGRVTCFP